MPHQLLESVGGAWALWAAFCGIAVPSLLIGAAGVWQLSDDGGPVSIHYNQKLLTPEVQHHGTLTYDVTIDRLKSCRGYISDNFTTLDNGPKTQVIVVRPLISTAPELKRQIRMNVTVPPSIRGKAAYKSILVSQCPNHERQDTIIETVFEVKPQ